MVAIVMHLEDLQSTSSSLFLNIGKILSFLRREDKNFKATIDKDGNPSMSNIGSQENTEEIWTRIMMNLKDINKSTFTIGDKVKDDKK